MSTPGPSDDHAQREMEQHALRNVRGLVDKMDSLEAAEARTQKRMLVGIIIGAVVVVGIIVGTVMHVSSKYGSGKTIVIDSAKPPKGGAPR